jgi:hypothetical protein
MYKVYLITCLCLSIALMSPTTTADAAPLVTRYNYIYKLFIEIIFIFCLVSKVEEKWTVHIKQNFWKRLKAWIKISSNLIFL